MLINNTSYVKLSERGFGEEDPVPPGKGKMGCRVVRNLRDIITMKSEIFVFFE